MKKIQFEKMPKTYRKGSTIFIISMLIISLLWFAVFYVGVNFNSILMAFKTVVGVTDNGEAIFEYSLKNYEILWNELTAEGDTLIKISIRNTLKYFALNFFVTIPITYFVSYFLYKKIFLHKFLRVLFYVPSIVSSVAMVIIFKNMIGGFGPLDNLISWITGAEMPAVPAFLSNPEYATNTILFYTFWTGFGVNIVLFQGAMGRIPEEVIEASKIDGVNWWQELFHVITPMVWPTISMSLIVAMTGIFMSSGPILLFATGEDTYTLSYYIFSQVRDSGIFYYPASMGVFFTAISMPIVFLFRFIMDKLDPKIEY